MDIWTSVHGHDGIPGSEGGTGTKGNSLSETTSKHGSTRGRDGEYVTGSKFTVVLGLDSYLSNVGCGLVVPTNKDTLLFLSIPYTRYDMSLTRVKYEEGK